MKNQFIYIFIFSLIILNCVSNNPRSNGYLMENAVYNAAKEIEIRIKPDDTIAVLNINSSNENLSIQIITWFENYLLETGNVKIVSRQRIETVLGELNFGLSGYISDDSVQSVGKFLGASHILVGEIKIINNVSYLNVQILETETAMLIYSNSYWINNYEQNGGNTRQRSYRF